jgi:Putative transposase
VVQSGDGDGLERLARYLARPPVSLERMEWDRERGEVLYRTGRGHAEERGSEAERRDDVRDDVERIDELEFLARVVTQLPEPRKHSIRYYGYYAAVVRAKRGRAMAEAEASMAEAGNDAVGNDASKTRGEGDAVCSLGAGHSAVASEPDTAERKQLRKSWAALIRRVYEVDPLLCACGATMRIVAIITERSVITKIPDAPGEGSRGDRDGGIGPRPSPPPAPRAGARSLHQLNPRQQAGAMTGRGEACSLRQTLQRRHLQRSLSRRLHASGPPKPPLLPSKINPESSESSASMGKGARSSESHTPWSRTGNAFSYPPHISIVIYSYPFVHPDVPV